MELDDTKAQSARGSGRDTVPEPSSDRVADHLAGIGERFEPGISVEHRKASVAAALFGEEPSPVKIGRFTIVRKLGSGGMGVVYVAYDEQLDRRVAVKLLRNNVASPDARARFVREGQAMARLSHPNVVTVYDAGVHDEQLFVAMEFVDGQDLRAWIKAEPRDWRAVVEVFRQAGEGLAAAHEAGLVHRDFKPDNVLVGHGKRVCVADFGLAQQFDRAPELDAARESSSSESGSLTLTRTGALMGTPAYMAPEQWAGARTDARGDQFSFCAALWEGLYGRRAFAGANMVELSKAVRSGDIHLPPVDSDVPPWLRAILMRGLAVDPDQRWPSMRALLDAIGSDPIARRRRVALWLAGASATLTAMAALGWLAVSELRHNARQAYWNAITAELLEIERERGLGLAQDEARRSRDATRMSVLRGYDSPLAVSRHEDPTVALALLREVEGELRGGSEWISKANELLGRPLADAVLEGHREGVGPLLFSVDGAWLYSGSDDGEVRRWDPHTGVGELLFGHGKMIEDLALSPDGELLASASDDGTVRLWSAAGGRSRVLARHDRSVMAVEFDARGRLLASASADGSVQVHALDGGEVVHIDVGSPALTLSFDREAARVLVGRDDGTADLWQLPTASEPEPRRLARLEGHTAPLFHALMLDGDRAVTGSDDGSARLWRLDQVPPTSIEVARHAQPISSLAVFGSQIATGSVDGSMRIGSLEPPHDSRSLPAHADMVWGLQFTPDGRELASGSFDRTARLTRVDGRGVPQVLVGHRQALFRVALDPTGRWLATGSYDSTIRVWDLTRPRLTTALVGHRDAISSLTLDATGARVLTASHDGSARLWDSRDGTLLAQLDGGGSALQHAVFSPDGRYVATADGGGGIALWQPDVGTRRELVGHDHSVWRLAFDPGGTRLASGCDDGTARIWHVADDHPPLILRGHEAGVRAVNFEPSGARLITASSDGTLRVWAVEDGSMQQLVRAHEGKIAVLVRSPDGHTLATGSDDGTAKLWSELGAAPIVLPGHGKQVWSIRFDEAGRRVVTASHDGHARVWSVDDGRLLATLGGDADFMWDASFVGDRIVTASSDGAVRIHSLDAATSNMVLSRHAAQVFALAITPDHARMVSAGTDGSVMLWQLTQLDTDGDRLLARMGEVTSFCLSPAQRMSELGEAPEQASAAAAACTAAFGRRN